MDITIGLEVALKDMNKSIFLAFGVRDNQFVTKISLPNFKL